MVTELITGCSIRCVRLASIDVWHCCGLVLSFLVRTMAHLLPFPSENYACKGQGHAVAIDQLFLKVDLYFQHMDGLSRLVAYAVDLRLSALTAPEILKTIIEFVQSVVFCELGEEHMWQKYGARPPGNQMRESSVDLLVAVTDWDSFFAHQDMPSRLLERILNLFFSNLILPNDKLRKVCEAHLSVFATSTLCSTYHSPANWHN